MEIGAFEISYGRRSQVIYRAHQKCHEVSFIRRKNWLEIESEFPLFYKMIKTKAFTFYKDHIMKNINSSKRKMIKKMK
jgi:hypothetical protein